ncbi:MAG: trypsin-like peptidase domain-containing protein [Comamonadaceae bacterium]|uniref:S1C family serine protease n=1 Tax=Candidatus Skiveiella danica TaxID=3386177 RepID=UPI001B7712EB|nr:trypsin-like peptidase domain-containing protein [Comamonadaceae bacterium]MBP8100931.1 trypsin-like peptidase domain-containing protein [Burkholderiaceae bacterium]
MRKTALYSRSAPRPGPTSPSSASDAEARAVPMPDTTARARWQRAAAFLSSPRGLWIAIGVLTFLLLFTLAQALRPGARALTQEDIDAAVLSTLEKTPLPSPAARAAEVIRPSVVRVTGYRAGKKGEEDIEHGVGTGVVIVDKGVILTNLHVVQAADTIKVLFADGLEATASITGAQPENDLAVLQAHKIPDDLIPATMRSTHDLLPGDQVVAVGFPFGIGPSYSAGVISGLKRVFRSPEGKQKLTNLIQFDAAANPGNSGGPLVTMDGEVVGIVTAILNPTPARTFLGIAFAVPIENAAAAVGLHPF